MSEIKLKKIVYASLFARTFAAVIDFVITAFVGIGAALGATEIAKSTPSVKGYQNEYIEVMTDSNLIEYKNKEVSYKIYNDYKEYETLFTSFYCDFLPSKVDYEYTHDTYWYNVHIYGLKDEKGLYSSKDLNDNVLTISKHIGSNLFTYELDNENQPLYDQIALPKALNNDKSQELSKEDNLKLLNFYYVSDEDAKNIDSAKEYKYIYFYALSELTSIPQVVKAYNRYNLLGVTIPVMVAIIFTMLIFYFVLPMIFKDGETLGKLIMHICLVNKLGYKYPKSGLIIRFLIPASVVAILLLFTGLSLLSIIIFSVIVLISYLLTIFTKEHKAIHDYLAGSLVIDKRESTFFKDYSEEEKFEKDTEKFDSLLKEDKDVSEDESVLYVNPHYREEKDKKDN